MSYALEFSYFFFVLDDIIIEQTRLGFNTLLIQLTNTLLSGITSEDLMGLKPIVELHAF